VKYQNVEKQFPGARARQPACMTAREPSPASTKSLKQSAWRAKDEKAQANNFVAVSRQRLASVLGDIEERRKQLQDAKERQAALADELQKVADQTDPIGEASALLASSWEIEESSLVTDIQDLQEQSRRWQEYNSWFVKDVTRLEVQLKEFEDAIEKNGNLQQELKEKCTRFGSDCNRGMMNIKDVHCPDLARCQAMVSSKAGMGNSNTWQQFELEKALHDCMRKRAEVNQVVLNAELDLATSTGTLRSRQQDLTRHASQSLKPFLFLAEHHRGLAVKLQRELAQLQGQYTEMQLKRQHLTSVIHRLTQLAFDAKGEALREYLQTSRAEELLHSTLKERDGTQHQLAYLLGGNATAMHNAQNDGTMMGKIRSPSRSGYRGEAGREIDKAWQAKHKGRNHVI